MDDMVDVCVHLVEAGGDDGLFNAGAGKDVAIRELAGTVMRVVGFEGEVVFDSSKLDGTPRKLLDLERMRDLGWTAAIPLVGGTAMACRDFLRQGA